MGLVKAAVTKSSAGETAQYIAGLAKELRTLAAKSELGFLAYLLSMVEQEADAAASRGDTPLQRSAGPGA